MESGDPSKQANVQSDMAAALAKMNLNEAKLKEEAKKRDEEKKESGKDFINFSTKQLDSKNFVVDLQTDKTWDEVGVPQHFSKNMQDMGMSKPSIIQTKSIPQISKEPTQNFMFQSPNGSGKTLAFGLPAIMRVDPNIQSTQVFIIAHTNELQIQTTQILQRICQDTGINVAVGNRETDLKATNHVIVSNVGWLKNQLSGRRPFNISNLKLVIYDEADEIFNQQSNRPNIAQFYTKFQSENIKPQTVLFSATFNEENRAIIDKVIPGDLKKDLVGEEELKLEGVKMFKIQAEEIQKAQLINEVYSKLGSYQTMIFANQKKEAEMLEASLKRENIAAQAITSNMDRNEISKIVQEFRKENLTCLICTNMLARGIDVPEVDLVINYDIPVIMECGFQHPDYANYMHRVGRTGRFGSDGVSLSIFTDETQGDILDLIQDKFKLNIETVTQIEEIKVILDEMRQANAD